MDQGMRTSDGSIADLSYMRYVGWSEGNHCKGPSDNCTNPVSYSIGAVTNVQNQSCLQQFFSPSTVRLISRKVTELTLGVDPHNRPILVPDYRITEVMSSVYWNYQPPVGDIHSRYILPSNEPQNMVQSMIDQTIEIITNNIRVDQEIVENNQKLSAWVQVLGDFNANSLRAHPVIKIRDRRPATMQFFQNY